MFTVQQGLAVQILEVVLEPAGLFTEVRQVFFGLGQFQELLEATQVALQPGEAVDDAAQPGTFLADLPCVIRVVPQTRIVDYRFKLLKPGAFAGDVKDTPGG